MKEKVIATFKALVRYDGAMVAAVASIPGGRTRFFLNRSPEAPDPFIGRIATWIKDQGGTGLEMNEPQALAEGVDVGEVLLRIMGSLGIGRQMPEEGEIDIPDAALVWGAGSGEAN